MIERQLFDNGAFSRPLDARRPEKPSVTPTEESMSSALWSPDNNDLRVQRCCGSKVDVARSNGVRGAYVGHRSTMHVDTASSELPIVVARPGRHMHIHERPNGHAGERDYTIADVVRSYFVASGIEEHRAAMAIRESIKSVKGLVGAGVNFGIDAPDSIDIDNLYRASGAPKSEYPTWASLMESRMDVDVREHGDVIMGLLDGVVPVNAQESPTDSFDFRVARGWEVRPDIWGKCRPKRIIGSRYYCKDVTCSRDYQEGMVSECDVDEIVSTKVMQCKCRSYRPTPPPVPVPVPVPVTEPVRRRIPAPSRNVRRAIIVAVVVVAVIAAFIVFGPGAGVAVAFGF